MNARFVTLVLLLFTVLGAADTAWADDMNAWLDRSRIGEGETVRLMLEVQGQVSDRPDTAPLERDFEILGLSTGSRVNIVNGRTDARTTWTLTLSPKRSGALTIPALRAGHHMSAPLTLEVSEAQAPSADSGANILIETEFEPRTPYVQGQVLYTVRLLHAVPISSGQLSEPNPENTLVQRLGEDREYAATRNGRRYQVIERRYALFPQTSGPLELTAPVFNGETPDASRRRANPFKRFFGNDSFFGTDPFDDLMTPTRRVRIRGEAARLDVRPRPDAAQGIHWLPAEQLELTGEWQPDSNRIQAGEPVTLVLELKAQGLTAGQLPGLEPESVDGFKVYPDQPQRQTDTLDTGVTGHLQQKIAFIPERAGELVLPAIEMHWWDTVADQQRVAALPSLVIEVLPVSAQPVQAATDMLPLVASGDAVADQAAPSNSVPDRSAEQPQPPRASSPWPWISAALATAWLLTLLLWWRRTRRFPTVAGEKPPSPAIAARAAARKRFLAACQAGDAKAAHASLLAWAAAHWPDDPPSGLDALARRIQDREARGALAELNRAIYREGGPWSGTRLAACLQQLPKTDPKADTGKTVLAPLYPDRAKEKHIQT